SFEELLSQLATMKVVVASRFHNLLLALMLGKPALAISFHEKDDSLMTAVGLQEFCQDIANLNVSTLIEQFVRLEEYADRLRQKAEGRAIVKLWTGKCSAIPAWSRSVSCQSIGLVVRDQLIASF